MARIESNWETILLRLLARLKDQVADATDHTAIISDNPDELPPAPGGNYFYVVSPPPSFAFTEQFEGGEPEQAQVHTTFVVTIHSTYDNDPVGGAQRLLTHSTRGLLPECTNVLKAFLSHDLQDADGNEILNEPIHPSNCSIVRPDRSHARMQVALDIKFDWDLS